MTNEEVKLSEDVLKELRAQRATLASVERLYNLAKYGHDTWLHQQLSELGLSLDKGEKYNIDAKEGIITVTKFEPVKRSEEKNEEVEVADTQE